METSSHAVLSKPFFEEKEAFCNFFNEKKPALFLDFDGTLAPIVSDPKDAAIPKGLKVLLEALASKTFIGIISGRGLESLQEKISMESVVLAGSHGFEFSKEIPPQKEIEKAKAILPELYKAGEKLAEALAPIKGAFVEFKKFALAVHYRNIEADKEPLIHQMVRQVLQNYSRLKSNSGKKVYDIKPAVEWHKGAALAFMANNFIHTEDYLPVFIGDDITDEDAFREVKKLGGFAIIVGKQDRETYADYYLNGIEEVKGLLELISQHIDKNFY
jgi:trehalose 6-phosphate phosphatase